MALFGDFKEGYTRTGEGFFSRASNYLSYIPGIGTAWAFGSSMIGAGIESIGWLLRGKVGSAATVLATGAVGGAVNAANGLTWGALNLGSTLTTGRSVSVHARKLTEEAIGGVTGVLGMKPQVLASYPAGIGSVGAGAAQAGPGRFVSDVARSRGEDPNAAYARLSSNQSDHLAALEAAQGQSAYRGM